MTHSPRLLILCAGLSACASGTPEPPNGAAGAHLSEESPIDAPPEPVLLDEGLEARPVPPPPDADPDRVLELLTAVADLPVGARVLDLRYAEDAVLAIHADHSLWIHDESGRRQLDEHVEAPLAVRGSAVAYARGEMPFFEIARIADVRAGEVEALTEGYGPAWNPALGPDGDVVFVSSRAGRPALYRVRPGAPPVRLPDEGAFPSSLHAPDFDGRVLRFEDEAGAPHALTLDPQVLEPGFTGALR